MAKLKTDAITQADLIEFLNDQSDFAFELEMLHTLSGCGFSCQHSGTYDDPVSRGLPRWRGTYKGRGVVAGNSGGGSSERPALVGAVRRRWQAKG
jgi:hypothetical protein